MRYDNNKDLLDAIVRGHITHKTEMPKQYLSVFAEALCKWDNFHVAGRLWYPIFWNDDYEIIKRIIENMKPYEERSFKDVYQEFKEVKEEKEYCHR